MQTKSDLEIKLEEIKELKAEYGIGSQQAHDYLKVYKQYDELANRIGQKLIDEGINYKPKNREVSNICESIMGHTSRLINIIAGKRGIEDQREEKIIVVLPYVESLAYKTMGVGSPNDNLEVLSIFKLNYEPFLLDFFKTRSSLKNDEESFREVFHRFINDDNPVLKNGGFSYTIHQVASNASSLTEDFKIKLEEDEEDEEDYSQDYLEMLEDFSDDFISWLSYGTKSNTCGKLDLEGLTSEERLYLFCSSIGEKRDLYERAKTDRVLGNLWTERRIALNTMIQSEYEGYSLDEKIEREVDLYRDRCQRTQKRLKEAISLNIPFLIDRNKDFLARDQYIIQAIVSNKKWLKRVLSS